MYVDVCDLLVRQHGFNAGLELSAVNSVGSDHHAVGVIGAQREQSLPQLLWDLIDRVEGLFAFAYVDGKARAVR